MALDPYATLGLQRDATPEQIRLAFRKLAKQHHPDLNPGSSKAEQRFKEINAANALLSDPERRARFDRGEIDAEGAEMPPEPPRYRTRAEGPAGARYHATSGGDEFDDLFGDFFRRGDGAPVRMRGADVHYGLAVEFLDAVTGATRSLAMPDGRTLEVRIPPGIEEGQVLRLKGQGEPGWNGGPPGDALIEVHVVPHPRFRREGRDVTVEVPVSLKQAVLGARLAVPTPAGEVMMTVPPRSDNGARLRLRGRGVAAHGNQPAGDLYVTLRLSLADADAALADFLAKWTPSSRNPL
jgi:DnaJ-class molecular chaperone